jgi:Fe2+ or Zn2+ uptake regulation protein
MVAVTRLDDVLAVLRASGGRITSCRRAILQALIDHPGHPTAEHLTSQVQAQLPDVHESTVYRFLDDLEEIGVIDHVHLGHGPAVYHFAEDAHHHLVCESCDAVIEVPHKMFDALRRRLQAEFAFELKPRHFAVPGRCAACAAARP